MVALNGRLFIVSVVVGSAAGDCSGLGGGWTRVRSPACPVRIGDPVPAELDPEGSRRGILAGPGRFLRRVELVTSACRFTLAFDDEHIVRYVHTKDARFRSIEGYRVGTTYATVRHGGHGSPRRFAGWGYGVSLAGGWHAGFRQGDTLADGAGLESGTPIGWFFRGGPASDPAARPDAREPR